MDTEIIIKPPAPGRKIDSNKIKTMADIRLLLKVLEIRVDDTHKSYEELSRLFEDEEKNNEHTRT